MPAEKATAKSDSFATRAHFQTILGLLLRVCAILKVGAVVFNRTDHEDRAFHAAGRGTLNRLSSPMTLVLTVSAPPIYYFAGKL